MFYQNGVKKLTRSEMPSKLNWNFKIHWVGEDHLVMAFKQDNEEWQEFLFSVKEYAEYMQLIHEFNSAFEHKLNQKLLDSYNDE